jgi:hypothetical protein
VSRDRFLLADMSRTKDVKTSRCISLLAWKSLQSSCEKCAFRYLAHFTFVSGSHVMVEAATPLFVSSVAPTNQSIFGWQIQCTVSDSALVRQHSSATLSVVVCNSGENQQFYAKWGLQ